MSANSASAAPEAEQPSTGSGPGPRIPKVPFWAQIVAGLVLGVLLGWIARSQDVSWLVTTLDQIGSIFVQLLKLAVAPLVFFAILVSITNLRKVNNAARLATRTLLWFMIT
ncbi:dicarboxylate/amino acid:cation symporter, partial [Streptomyces sp. SID8455]|nr:dicarboxylate/amino acid:cation symporter [Streptomyces sp. SID8455]